LKPRTVSRRTKLKPRTEIKTKNCELNQELDLKQRTGFKTKN
jgi:hypothetical protein